jgi:hypothetical protein
MRWQLVAIKWEDVTTLARFGLNTDFEGKRLYKLSVGFLIEETDEYVVIADDMDLSGYPEAPNNYGTLIPKGCIRERCMIWPTPDNPADLLALADEDAAAPPKVSRHASASLRRFFEENPHVLASAQHIARGLGMHEEDVAEQLGALERRDVVKRLVGGIYVNGPGRKAHLEHSRKAAAPRTKRRRANPSR